MMIARGLRGTAAVPARQQPRRHSASCPASSVDFVQYSWEQLRVPQLKDGGRLFSEEVRVKAHEVGPNQQSNVVTVSNMLQECASNHIVALRGRSEQYFAADPELAKLDLIFVLTRMQIRMNWYPRWGDIVKVETYFQQEGRVGARRDWLLTSPATGEQYGCATSSWVMVNYVTRRLSKMPDAIREEYRKLMPDPPKHCINAAETRLKLPDVSDVAECIQHVATPVHLDMNNHVNNTAYLTWILDSIPEEIQDSCVLAQYEVEYKAEGHAGFKVCAGSKDVEEVATYPGLPDNCRQFVSTVRHIEERGESELIRSRTTWVAI